MQKTPGKAAFSDNHALRETGLNAMLLLIARALRACSACFRAR